MTEPPDRELVVFSAARRLPTADRPAYLDQACSGDSALRQRVEELLLAEEEAGAFLDSPAAVPPQQGGTVGLAGVLAEKPGDRIGRYKLLQQIGEGGCGVVYMAEQEEPVRRRVALKVIKLGMDTKSVIARFEAERQALALMDHPNIAKVLDAGATETGRPYFVMELIRGIRITDYCDQNNLPTRQRLDLFVQVCQAIQHAHQKGVIHRDIKPSNILVTMRDSVPVPKVIDFGIAKATTDQRLTDKTLFTAFQQFIGTPAYMSPEQAEMSELGIDTRSDIYSLGVLLYELLTGQTPFDAKELLQAGLDAMRRTIRETEPARPSTKLSTLLEAERTSVANHRQTDAPKLVNLLRGDLDWIVIKSLEKDRARRYETANGLAMDVQRYLDDEPVVARPPSRLYEFQKTARRHKLGFTATAAVVLTLVAGVAVSAGQAMRAKRAEKEQTRLRQIAETKERKSEQVSLFLRDMLNAAEPSAAAGHDTAMLREILDKTAERVGNDLTNQPEVEAELRGVIAQVYYRLGQYQKAEEMYAQAVSVWKKLNGPENLDLANALDYLAMSLLSQGKFAEAELREREALAMFRRIHGDEHPDVAGSLDAQASILWSEGKASEAATIELEALAMHRRTQGNENLRVAQSLDNLAAMLSTEGQLVEAENLARQGLAIRSKLSGNPSVVVAISLNNLACILEKGGALAEAESKHREALAMRRKLYGNDNQFSTQSAGNLVQVLVRRGKLTEAETLAREYLAVCERLFPEDWKTSNFRSLLGSSLLGLQRHAEAEPLLLSGYAGMKQREDKVPNEGRRQIKETLQRLVQLYEQTNRPDQLAEWRKKLAQFDEVERVKQIPRPQP